ncbi:TPA: hypothetical protein EYP70_05535 [Candidatus Bathyarchaeota archaeon]|nr:hypothetical protein [Candidatus Bathyarchaeota archaeon]
MCELLSISANQEMNIQFSWRGFRHRGEKNPDGWGIGFYRDRGAVVFKEPLPAPSNTIAQFLVSHPTAIRSKILISNVLADIVLLSGHQESTPYSLGYKNKKLSVFKLDLGGILVNDMEGVQGQGHSYSPALCRCRSRYDRSQPIAGLDEAIRLLEGALDSKSE